MENLDLKKFYLFSFLEEKDIKRLKEISVLKSFSKEEILFYKGDRAKKLHFLVSGRVKLYTHDHKGNERVIHTFTGPSLIAEIANYNESVFPANSSFESDAQVLLIDYEKFKNEFLLKPEIAMFFIKSLSQKIKALETFINYNITTNSEGKIAKFLLEKEDLLKDLKQVKIAHILNISPETFSRKMAIFKKEGILENEKGYIKILDYSKLKDFVI